MITQSGLYNDINGQQFLVTQGSVGYTLVDKKKILFRLFVHPSILARITAVFARIKYVPHIPNSEILFSTADLLIENSAPNGPSVGVVLEGRIFPSVSIRYFVEFYIITGEAFSYRLVISDLKFERSGRLRVLQKPIQSITGTAPWGNQIKSDLGWYVDLIFSMDRLGAMLPVSDGISQSKNPDPDDGLAFLQGEVIDAWPSVCPSGNPPSKPDDDYPSVLVCPDDEMLESNLQEAKDLNSSGTRIDITVIWRHRDPIRIPPRIGEPCLGDVGECCGGHGHFDPPPQSRYASAVGGGRNGVQNTAPIMAQEIAHNFGVVAKDSPHVDSGTHSKDLILGDPFAFDFVRLRPYSAAPPGPIGPYLGDVMSIAWQQGFDLTLFSAYDWEHLRKRLVNLPTQALTNKDRMKRPKKPVEEVKNAFVGVEKIQVKNPKSTLYSKTGFEWHWTHIGFQPLIKGKTKRNRRGLAFSAESVLHALRELGAKEVYVPIEGKPLGFVVSPARINSIGCKLDGVRVLA